MMKPCKWGSVVDWSPIRLLRPSVRCEVRVGVTSGGGAALRPSRPPRPLALPASAGGARMLGPAWASTMATSTSASSMAVAAVSLVAPLLLCPPASSLFAPPSLAAVTSPRGLSVIRRGGERSLGWVSGGLSLRFFSNLRSLASAANSAPAPAASARRYGSPLLRHRWRCS